MKSPRKRGPTLSPEPSTHRPDPKTPQLRTRALRKPPHPVSLRNQTRPGCHYCNLQQPPAPLRGISRSPLRSLPTKIRGREHLEQSQAEPPAFLSSPLPAQPRACAFNPPLNAENPKTRITCERSEQKPAKPTWRADGESELWSVSRADLLFPDIPLQIQRFASFL
ncbi:hypothetical protein AOLI_G00307330 [Acnodon oligacanthus]